jgi:hypothetical protein
VIKEFLARDNSAREKSELESFPWDDWDEVKGDRPDSSQCQNLRCRLTVADACDLLICVLVGIYVAGRARSSTRELLQVLVLV